MSQSEWTLGDCEAVGGAGAFPLRNEGPGWTDLPLLGGQIPARRRPAVLGAGEVSQRQRARPSRTDTPAFGVCRRRCACHRYVLPCLLVQGRPDDLHVRGVAADAFVLQACCWRWVRCQTCRMTMAKVLLSSPFYVVCVCVVCLPFPLRLLIIWHCHCGVLFQTVRSPLLSDQVPEDRGRRVPPQGRHSHC